MKLWHDPDFDWGLLMARTDPTAPKHRGISFILMERGTPGVFHGSLSYLLQDADGQVRPAHSVAAGLDYPGVGPEHAFFKDAGRILYEAVTDREALAAFPELSRLEGILPALESAHAVAWVLAQGRRDRWRGGNVVVINLSGRGDKDVALVAELTGAGR